jgi:halimadienyl-diphosphate synthase
LQESGYNRDITLNSLASYWREPGYVVTYGFERDPSTSANIHALEALTVAGNKPDAYRLVNFLEEQRRGLPFWQDKWHISPYYPTSHALAAYCRLDAARATSDAVVNWIAESQNPNGSWGWENRQGTLEETAYALQALMVYAQTYGWLDDMLLVAKAGADYLRREYRPYVWEEDTLWIAKTRYSPLLVVRSTVLSALLMAEEHRL